MQKPELLRRQRARNQVKPCQIAAGAAEAGDEAGLNRLDPSAKDDGDRRGCRLGRQRGRTVTGDEYGDLPANQVRCLRRQAIVLTLYPTVFNRDVLAFNIAGFGQRLAEACEDRPTLRQRRTAEEPDHRHRRLLCARRKRPCDGCVAEECDEVSPSHAKLPVEGKAYQRAALCVTAKLARR
jgi:hypothetical protein